MFGVIAPGLGDRIKALMAAHSITQSKLAKLIGTTQAAVSNWCSGNKVPGDDNLQAIAKELGANLGWLVTAKGSMFMPDERQEREKYRQEREWIFRPAPADGGRDYGNANVWSFKSDVNTLVREVLQNCRDAALGVDSRVKVVFRLIRLAGEELAKFQEAMGWDQVYPHLEVVAKQPQKLGVLLKGGLKEIRDRGELFLLIIEDSNTRGLTGPEFDSGNFMGLCRNNLDSNKEGSVSRGGAFGLGKAVLWRASRLATVLFASRPHQPEEGQGNLRVFGRCELAWHRLDDPNEFQGPGWMGRHSETRSDTAESIWDNETLAADLKMKRSDDSSGTTVCVVGFHDPQSDQPPNLTEMAKEIKMAAARNFFPNMVWNQLQVTVETWDGTPLSVEEVSAPQLQPEYCAALQAYRTGEVGDQLDTEGDVACARVTLDVPRRTAQPDAHPACTHEALLLVRHAEEPLEDSPDGQRQTRNELAVLRGPGMVVEFRSLQSITLGAKPFHAVLLAGRAAGNQPNDLRADEFLRTAEPPAHNEWTITPDLQTAYVRGGGAAIKSLLSRTVEKIRELVKPTVRDYGDGPESLKQLFRIGTKPPSAADRPRVEIVQHGIDDQGRWDLHVKVRIKSSAKQVHLIPVVRFAAETGGGSAVPWSSLTAVRNCTVDGKGKVIVEANRREAEFRGVTDKSRHLIDATEAAVVVDVRKATGGDS